MERVAVLVCVGTSSVSGDPPCFFVSPYGENGNVSVCFCGRGSRDWSCMGL